MDRCIEWCSQDSLDSMSFQDDQDPFTVPDEHPAAMLQMTKRAVKDFILTQRFNPAEQGVRLTKLWKQTVIRRTPQSRIPFNTGRKIADSLPRVKAAILSCSYTVDERRRYNEIEDKPLGKLLVPGDGQKKPKWSLGVQRKLLLLTAWLKHPKLDKDRDLKAINMKKVFEEPHFWLNRFEKPRRERLKMARVRHPHPHPVSHRASQQLFALRYAMCRPLVLLTCMRSSLFS